MKRSLAVSALACTVSMFAAGSALACDAAVKTASSSCGSSKAAMATTVAADGCSGMASAVAGKSCSGMATTVAADGCTGMPATVAGASCPSMATKVAADGCSSMTAAKAACKDTCSAMKVAAGTCCSSKGSSKTMATTVGWTSDRSKMDIVDTAVGAGSFNTLAAALGAANLVDALKGDGPFTVFAPTDAAFAKLPKGTVEMLLRPENVDKLTAILTYHVVPAALPASRVVNVSNATTLNGQRIDITVSDKGVMVDGAKVTKTDIMCRNGIIHVIDSVIMPATDSIVDVAASAGTFQTLVAAVEAAGLADTLMGPGPFTVLAPTDEAFAKLPKGTIASLLEPKNRDQLVSILTYHVIPGRVYARDAVAAERFETVQGGTVRFGFRDGRLTVNDAGVSATDLETSNGVIFVIDRVILPNGS